MNWAGFLGVRTLRFIATFFLVTLMTAMLMDFVPGNPAYYLLGETANPEQVAALEEEYGLNEPFLERYQDWLGSVVQGDLGRSFLTRQPVSNTISEGLPITLELALLALIVALLISVPLAMVTAYRPGSTLDRAVQGITSAMISVPNLVIAIFLLFIFSVQLGWFPVVGWTPLTESVTGNLKTAALPVLALALNEVVSLQRVLRSDLISTLQQDYITLARSKGVRSRTILWKHALKPASSSLITLSGLFFARLLGGTVVIESIFAIPGLGFQLISATLTKDLFVVQGIAVLLAVSYLVVNFMVDILYGAIDPRVRAQAKS